MLAKICALAMISISVTGCVATVSSPAICANSLPDRKAHARALVVDGGPQSQRTGAVVLAKLDAGCKE